MSRGLALLLSVLAASLVACPSFDYDAGRFACEVDDDCPDGSYCDKQVGGCEPDDGSGSAPECDTLCPSVHDRCPDFPLADCQDLCPYGTAACRQCFNTSLCQTLAACETRCSLGS